MIKKLKSIYKKEQFNPKIIGLFTNPFYFARRGLNKNVSLLIGNLSGSLLDVGCGSKPYESICNVDSYVGMEIDTPENRMNDKVDVFYNGITMPFDEKSFDSILTNQVLEHVFNPNVFLKEINRITKINGQILLTVPFVWDEHEQPIDYARYSSFGLKHLLSEKGFEIVESKKSNNGLSVIFQLMNAYLYKITLTKSVFINLMTTLLLMAPINILGLIFSTIMPKNNDLYLDNVILAKKIKDV